MNSVIAEPTHTCGVVEFVRSLVDDEVPSRCVHLGSPLASATTGGALRVDGGDVNQILP